MIQCEELDNMQLVLDEVQQDMADLHDQACTADDLDRAVIDRYWAQVTAWTDKYMAAFRDARLSTTDREWIERVRSLKGLLEEGFEIKEDFRVWLVDTLNEQIAKWEKELAEEKAEHPIGFWILDHTLGPIFDAIDWLLEKTTGRSLYDRVTQNQKTL